MNRVASGARVVLAAVSLLVLGGVAGIAADRALHRSSAPTTESAATAHEALAALHRAARLRPEQRAQIDSILAVRQTDVDAAWRDAREHVQRTVNSLIRDIEAVLDPDQIPPFRELVERLHGPDGLQPHH